MTIVKRTCLAFALLSGVAAAQSVGEERKRVEKRSHSKQPLVAGPARNINEAIASGAGATVTLQPVPPKTVPASNYPAGSTIVGQTLTLSETPARVWIEVHLTGWNLVARGGFARRSGDLAAQVAIDATDADGDGGGYDGDRADCMGAPSLGAGDLFPAIVPCNLGTCQGDASRTCLANLDCTGGTGPCINVHGECRAALSGVTASCPRGEPSRCMAPRPPFFPAGGPVCEFAFHDECDPHWIGTGAANASAVDFTTINTRMGYVTEPGEVSTDFGPSYIGTLVLDVPTDAKGVYVIDLHDVLTYLQNEKANLLPIAALNPAVIDVPCGACCVDVGLPTFHCEERLSKAECEALPGSNRVFRAGLTCDYCCNCVSDDQCEDADVCTEDVCSAECLCENVPVAGWNPATECCHPVTGVQAMVPPSTPCRAGGCSFGGSSGVPTLTDLDDGSPCNPVDPCNLPGVCEAGICVGEQYASSDCPKSRFISFDVAVGSIPVAYRVRLLSLHQPEPPYSAGVASDFSILEGEYRWVGPPGSYVESSTDPTVVNASYLQCEPHYHDWSTISLLHVAGSEVVPSSLYEVQSIPIGLDIGSEANYSAAVVIETARWGDVVAPYNPPDTSIQPDAGDLAAMLRKFRSLPGSILKPRSLMRSGLSDLPNLKVDVNFDQIAAVVDAFRGSPYPFAAPSPCP